MLAAVEALGYTPNLNARSLRSGQTQAISVLLPMTGTAFYDTLLGAVHQRLEAHDYDMALFPLLGAQRIRRFRDPSALLYRADALLIVSQDPQQLYAGGLLLTSRWCLVDAHHPHYHSVLFDNLAAGRLAAEVALGRRLPLVLLGRGRRAGRTALAGVHGAARRAFSTCWGARASRPPEPCTPAPRWKVAAPPPSSC